MAVDLLNYLRGEMASNGRAYQLKFDFDGISGTHTYQVQVDSAESDTFYQVKNKTWERLYFDNNFIYRDIDTGEGDNRYFVQTTDEKLGAIWSKRHLELNEFTERNPLVIHYHKDNCSERLRTQTPSKLTLLEIKVQHTFPTGVTLPDVIVLGWSLQDDMIEEKLYYAKNLGLVGWENTNRGTMFIAPSSLNGTQLVRETIACLPAESRRFSRAETMTHVRVKPTGDSGLNIRTQPRVAANNLIATIKPGSVLKLIKRNPVWWQVELVSAETFVETGVRGWAHSDFLEAAQPTPTAAAPSNPTDQPNALFLEVQDVDFLNVRTEPRVFDNTVIAALKTGALLEFLSQQGEWMEVVVARGSQFVGGRLTGYVHSAFVQFMSSQFNQSVKDITNQLPKHATKRYTTRRLDGIVVHGIHHTAVARTVTVDRIAAFHVDSRGWPGIGYTFFITAEGTIFQTNALETMSYATGNENHRVLSTVLAGSFMNGNRPTAAQIDALRWLHHVHIPARLGRKLPLKGHQEVRSAVTACPGNSWDLHSVIGEQPMVTS